MPAPEYVMPDPIPYRGYGMLTATEMAATLRVLRQVITRPSAWVSLAWSRDDQDAAISLARMQYTHVESPRARGWNTLALTEAGATYLAQLERAT